MIFRKRSIILLMLGVMLSACAAQATPAAEPTPAPSTSNADLLAIKSYLLDKVAELKSNTAQLKEQSDRYYALAQAAGFDYASLWQNNQSDVVLVIEQARASWMSASPAYERIEGIVAGVPSMAEYDVILDAGTSGEEGGDSVVPFDLTLPDGRVLSRPGNLFGVTESVLWGTHAGFVAPGVVADFDNDQQIEFSEALGDANVLKAGVDAMDQYVSDLQASAQAWQPTESDAFTALVTMVPTMSEYFDSWKNSRFVLGDASTQRDFVAISRLADIQDILSSLQVVYDSVKPLVVDIDSAQADQIGESLADLKTFVADVHQQEQAGQRFTPEDADLLGEEAQNRATAITGQITQIVAQLGIELQE